MKLKFWKKSCAICKVQNVQLNKYENRSGIRMIFCDSCRGYAQKRSFKLIKRYLVKRKDFGGIENGR